MNFDITNLLDEWEYRAGEIVVRKFKGKDGKEKIQLRVDLGLLQMDALGRPDGKKPYGHETLLEHYEARLAKHRKEHDGDDSGFKLNAEDCSRLHQEAIQFHHRYICLFQLKDYAGVIRDATRNLRVFDLVQAHAELEELSWGVQQLRPQLLMMQIRARASICWEDDRHSEAITVVEEGITEIRKFFCDSGRQELIEQSGEIQSLEAWMNDLRSAKPLSEREKLENALEEAVRLEEYEKAAKLRDQLRSLKPTI